MTAIEELPSVVPKQSELTEAYIRGYKDGAEQSREEGEWKKEVNEKLGKCLRVTYVCSACGCAVGCEYFVRRSFCPNCGAKMKG